MTVDGGAASGRAAVRLPDERTARVAWSRLAEPGDATARELIDKFGVVDALAVALRAATTKTAKYAARGRDLDPERDLEIADRCDARVITPADRQWPIGLDDLPVPPFCLFARGPLDLATATTGVAVVGSRASTAYGEYMAADLSTGLSGQGFGIVSGAAFGIDGAAHRATLAVDGQTIAVLAGGVDRPYPAAHSHLLAQIAEAGVVVSEVPPGSAPTRIRFLERNRLIAAMTAGTLVVEAGLRSGARNTARRAAEIGRPVGAVPGPATSMASAGCHQMVRDCAAVLVTDADEAAELFGRIGEHLAPVKRGPSGPSDDLDPDARAVWAVLPQYRSTTVDHLSRLGGLSPAAVMTGLGQLEAAGLVERRLDGWGRAR